MGTFPDSIPMRLDRGEPVDVERTLLNARSIALSDSASGVYLSGELARRLGIEKEMAARSRMLPGSPVGQSVASGEYEIGFQQNSELLPVRPVAATPPAPNAAR